MSYSPFRHIGSVFWKRRPIQLTFFLTKRCNSKCSFCFYRAGRDIPEEHGTELSLGEIEKISASMGKLLWLAFSGGEIFLRDDIVEIAKVFYERNKPSIILFPTNGLLTDVIREKIETVLKHCRNSTVVVKLSLDGPENIHDFIRGGKGSFQKTMQTYESLRGLIDEFQNFELGINTVYCSANQDYMDAVIEFVGGLDRIKTHTVSLVRGKGLEEIDIERYRETIDTLAGNLRKRTSGIYRFRGGRLKAAQDILQRRLIYDTETQKKKLIDCYAGRLNLVLTETGELYPCESFSMRMGNVRDNEYDIEIIMESGQSHNIISSIKDNGCFCSHECYLMTNILFSMRMYPRLMREYFKLAVD
ncbi:MAG: radical SAM protein [Nitrospirae bacterium]|nr:radical SAM protein [Nitrospirota bacterium]